MKTLLISDVPPTKKTSGSLLTWHLCKNFDANSLLGFFIVAPGLGHLQPEFPFEGQIKFKTMPKVHETRFRFRWLPKKLGFTVSYLKEIHRKYVLVPRYAKEVLSFAKENSADKIWIILQGQTMIFLADYLIKNGSLPVHIQVWDSPNWWIKAHQLDRFSAGMIRKSYQLCLKEATAFASPSFHMSKMHFEKHGKKSPTFIGITPSEYTVKNAKPKNPDKIVIGLAGQTYATNTLSYFISALDSMYWEFEGKKIEIHYWGYSELPAQRTRIIRKGYVSQDQLTKELSACDFLYCPYWFEADYVEEASTSFPSKLTTYLSAGTIVFFHGPQYSSPVSLIQSNEAGVCCFSTDVEAIKMYIRHAVLLKNKDQVIANAKKLVETCLSEGYLHSSFNEFINTRNV